MLQWQSEKEAIIIVMLLTECYCCLAACTSSIDVSIHLYPNYAQDGLLICFEKHGLMRM